MRVEHHIYEGENKEKNYHCRFVCPCKEELLIDLWKKKKKKKTLSNNSVIEGRETRRKERQTKSEINGKRRD